MDTSDKVPAPAGRNLQFRAGFSNSQRRAVQMQGCPFPVLNRPRSLPRAFGVTTKGNPVRVLASVSAEDASTSGHAIQLHDCAIVVLTSRGAKYSMSMDTMRGRYLTTAQCNNPEGPCR